MVSYRPDRQPLVAAGQVDHHESDLTATVAADVTLAELQTALASARQWLPIDGDPARTVGELVSTDSSGPLRLGYGHWRDLLLGVQFRNGSGELISAGGRTVKNVAGYDLTKFMVGQRGVFGELVTITTRTYRKPDGAILATFAPKAGLIGKLLPTALRPQWTLLTREALFCGYVGDEAGLAFYERKLPEISALSTQRTPVEQDVELRAHLWRGDFRAAVPPNRIAEFVTAADLVNWVADPAFGIVRGSADDVSRITVGARTVGGTATFSSPFHFDVADGPQRALLERLKVAFDPDDRLAPLPWKGRA